MAWELLLAEAGFCKFRHAEDLPILAAALSLPSQSSASATVVASSCVPSASVKQLETCPIIGANFNDLRDIVNSRWVGVFSKKSIVSILKFTAGSTLCLYHFHVWVYAGGQVSRTILSLNKVP
jgi:hypothetical protein